MRYLILIAAFAAAAAAGPHFGGRVGYYTGNEPRTGGDASNAIFGGQFVFPIMSIVSLEFSAGYIGTETDITLQDYLINYIEEEQGIDIDEDSLLQYLEDEWGWEAPEEQEFLQSYTATYHDLDLGATLKVDLPVGSLPVTPYVGGGAGAHFIVSDADLLIQYVQEQTGQGAPLDVYDKVHPEIHGVAGAEFQPPMLPLSFFAEYKYARTLGDDPGTGSIGTVYGGVNLGF
ncbi:hypothetical protein GX411_01860 [Candidatus Fermentibacteria bacterium]|nr:hypothetical protein [Candidatus Fermentibacteria bacterium]